MYIVVARHGERLDYIERDAGRNWISTAERPWDPPLSNNGLKQAKRLGEHLSVLLKEKNLPPITACYSSPFLRCRQTACCAVEVLNDQKNLEESNAEAEAILQVQIEMGLSESLNKSWYRSWALPGADGTWGYVPPQDKEPGKQPRGLDVFEDEELHPASKIPAQQVCLKWKDVVVTKDDDSLDSTTTTTINSLLETLQDTTYESSTTIMKPFALRPIPMLVETAKEQAERMAQVVTNKARANTTILLVSHGGPVTHLFEKLTGKEWHVHGESKYCCISIYECKKPSNNPEAVEGEGPSQNQPPNTTTAIMKWEPLLVNQSKYLDDLWSDGTANI